MSRRAEQVGQVLQRAIQQVIARGLQDPRVRGMVSVTGVRVSEDLRSAVVDVSIYPESAQRAAIRGLESAARHIRHEVGPIVGMRQVPELVFRLDESLKKQAAVLGAIARAAAEREEKGVAGREAGEPAGEGDRA